MTAGVSSTGFITKTLQDVLTDLEQDQLANVDATLDLSPETPLGQLNGIYAKKISELWDLAALLYAQLDPDAAEDVSLQNLSSITGTIKQSATKTKGNVTLNLNSSITVPLGAQVCVLGHPENPFLLDAAVTSTSATTYAGTVTALTAGPLFVGAGTLTQILTPTNGWNSVTNAADLTTGLPEETNTDLRVRRIQELFTPGQDSIGAIRAHVLEVTGVLAALVRENTTDNPLDPDPGSVAYPLPGHSFEVIVWDGTGLNASNNAIAQAIFDDKPAGSQVVSLTGTSSGTAVDSLGVLHTVPFTRVTQVPIYINYTVTTNGKYIGDSALAAAIAQYAQTIQSVGDTVVAALYEGIPLLPLALANSTIPNATGATDVSVFQIGSSPGPTLDVNVAITTRQIAIVSSGNIAITS